jgi:hypothetical protein
VSGSVPHPKGEVSVKLERAGSGLKVEVTLPTRREELTPLGQQAYDLEIARRNTPEWKAGDARKEQEYVERLEAEERALSGIRGWLLLPAIGMVASSVFYVAAIITRWSRVSGICAGILREQLPRGFDDVSAVVVVLFGALSILLTVAFLAKRWFVPRLMLVWLLANAGMSVGLAAWAASLGGSGQVYDALEGDAARGIVAAVVWGPYFLRSQRVRRTFVRRTSAV